MQIKPNPPFPRLPKLLLIIGLVKKVHNSFDEGHVQGSTPKARPASVQVTHKVFRPDLQNLLRTASVLNVCGQLSWTLARSRYNRLSYSFSASYNEGPNSCSRPQESGSNQNTSLPNKLKDLRPWSSRLLASQWQRRTCCKKVAGSNKDFKSTTCSLVWSSARSGVLPEFCGRVLRVHWHQGITTPPRQQHLACIEATPLHSQLWSMQHCTYIKPALMP